MNTNIKSFRQKHYDCVVRRLKKKRPDLLFLTLFENYNGVGGGHYKFKCLKCNSIFEDYISSGHDPKCPICQPHRLNINKGHPELVKLSCEFCKNEFEIKWALRKQRFCSVRCKCNWVRSNHWEEVECLHCKRPFKRRKNYKHWRNGCNKKCCSISCWGKCKEHIDKSRDWTIKNQPMNNQKSIDKISKTKLKKYGDPNFNNMDKNKETMLKNHGVPYAFWTGKKANGIRISKPQRKLFEEVKKQHSDAILESWLSDVQMSVDIYIPSEKRVIEFYGDYWHCNPKKYSPNYYNTQVRLKAKDIWKRDEQRKRILETNGYKVEIIWEDLSKRREPL